MEYFTVYAYRKRDADLAGEASLRGRFDERELRYQQAVWNNPGTRTIRN